MIGYDKLALNHQILLDLPFREGCGCVCCDVGKPHHSVSHAGKPTLPAWATDQEFQTGAEDGGGGIAQWSTNEHHSGRHSVYLSDEGLPTVWPVCGVGRIAFTVDILLPDITSLSYWFKCSPPQTTPNYEHAFPYMTLAIDTTGGHTPNAWIVLHSGPAAVWEPPQGVWTEWDLGEYDTWHCGPDTRTLAGHQAAMPNARVVAIKSALGEYAPIADPHEKITAYVDDIGVNGVVYSLEPPVTQATLASGLGVLEFNGLSEYLELASADCADLDFISGDYSIGCWINWASGNPSQIVIGRYELNVGGWEVYLFDPGMTLTLRHHHAATLVDGNPRSACWSAGWDFDTWCLMGISRTGGGNAIHYRNGVALTTTGDLVNPETCSQDLVAGARYTKDANYFKNKLWRPRAWGRALSAEEWAQLFEYEKHWFGM